MKKKCLYDYRAGHEDHKSGGSKDCIRNETVCPISGICNAIFFSERTGGKFYIFLKCKNRFGMKDRDKVC